jgi:hypothetical protein
VVFRAVGLGFKERIGGLWVHRAGASWWLGWDTVINFGAISVFEIGSCGALDKALTTATCYNHMCS